MKNRQLNLQPQIAGAPTTAELYALERAANAARAAEMVRLARAAANGVKALFAPTEKGLKHA